MMRFYILIVLFFLSIGPSFSQSTTVFDIARKGTLAEIEAIYKQNPELINTVDDRKSSPLLLACYRGNTDVALFLAKKVIDVNYNSGIGTALMAAVMSGKIEIVTSLIAAKADLNQTDSQGKTALIYAVFFNKNDIAKALINAGADKTKQDSDDKTALDFATFNKNTELIILLSK